jgi:hypothetical protein
VVYQPILFEGKMRRIGREKKRERQKKKRKLRKRKEEEKKKMGKYKVF